MKFQVIVRPCGEVKAGTSNSLSYHLRGPGQRDMHVYLFACAWFHVSTHTGQDPLPRNGASLINLIKTISFRHAQSSTQSRHFLIEALIPGDCRLCQIDNQSWSSQPGSSNLPPNLETNMCVFRSSVRTCWDRN